MYLYSSRSADSPKLNNTWGDFNKLINYIIDGGTARPFISIESTDINKVKIYFAESICPYILYQTILIENATNVLYNGQYFIEEINVVNKYMICYNKQLTSLLALESNTTITMRIKPSGLTRVYGGVADNRTVFRTASGMHYRIDDRNYAPLMSPAVTFNNNWLKICRVSMAKNYTSLDSTDDRIYPYNTDRPGENFAPHGQYIGQAYFIYNELYIDASSSSYYYPTSTISTRSQVDYTIYANESVIYIYIIFDGNRVSTSYNQYEVTRCYIMGDYTPIAEGYQPSLLMAHSFGNYPYNAQNSYTQTYNYSNNSLPSFPHSTTMSNGHQVLYDNLLNTASTCSFVGEFGIGNTGGSGSGGVAYLNRTNNLFYISDTLVLNGAHLFGKLIGVKWVNTSIVGSFVKNSETIRNGSLVKINNKYYIAQKAASGYSNTNGSYNCMAFIEMDR